MSITPNHARNLEALKIFFVEGPEGVKKAMSGKTETAFYSRVRQALKHIVRTATPPQRRLMLAELKKIPRKARTSHASRATRPLKRSVIRLVG